MIKTATPAAKRASTGAVGGGDGDDDAVAAYVEEEDVDSADVAADGSMFNDERGEIEVSLPSVAASIKSVAGGSHAFPLPDTRVRETPEADIPNTFRAYEASDGSVCRILDNFFICDEAGYAP